MAIVDQALRFLEILFLLIPVVAILLQTMISFYSQDDINAAEWKKGIAFTAAIFGLVFFGFAGILVIQLMAQNSANQTLVTAANAAFVGLAAVTLGVIITISDIFGTSETTRETESRKRNVDDEDDYPRFITGDGEEIEIDDQAKLDRVVESIKGGGEE